MIRKNLFVIILISLVQNNLLNCMETSVCPVAPIILTKEEIAPDELYFPMNQAELDLANKGDAKSQYILGMRYLKGLTPDKKIDLEKAEQWLLKSKKQDYLPAYTALIDLASAKNNTDQLITYVNDSVKRGFVDQYSVAGVVYLAQKKYKQAREYFEKTIKSLEPYQQHPFLKKIRDEILVELANLFNKGLGGPKDPQKANEILTRLAAENNTRALYFLALNYLYGNEVVKKNPHEAQRLFLKIEKIGNPTDINSKIIYWRTLGLLGLMFEKGFDHVKPDLKKAVEYFKKDKVYGEFHIARLILTQKISGDRDQAKKVLEKSDNTFAAYLYGTILISEGEPEKGLIFLKKAAAQDTTQALVYLQLAIAYHYGFGVDQDEKKSQEYFQRISNDPDTRHRSLFLARGYIRFFGIGVKQDINKGLELINESENKIDDVFFSTEQIFPAIIKLRAEQELLKAQQAEHAAEQLIKEEEACKKKKEKKKKVPALIIAAEKVNENPFKVTPDEWNAHFSVNDGSFVSKIDTEEQTFIIDDPQHNEQLIVKAKKLPSRNFTEIDALKFHKRIFERQGLGKISLRHRTQYNHTFAEMLDYVIQYIGELVPFAKDGGSDIEDQLVADVVRKDMKTGVEKEVIAEYTFGQKGKDVYVYHRLLRPVKHQLVAN